MAVRLAADWVDAERWQLAQWQFFTGANLKFKQRPLSRILERFSAPHVVSTTDDTGICELKVDESRREARVELLLPVTRSRQLLFPILLESFEEMRRRYRSSLDWRVWAVFFAGKDANGELDGGEGECKAWAEFFPDTDLPSDREGREFGWYIESTLRRLLRTHWEPSRG